MVGGGDHWRTAVAAVGLGALLTACAPAGAPGAGESRPVRLYVAQASRWRRSSTAKGSWGGATGGPVPRRPRLARPERPPPPPARTAASFARECCDRAPIAPVRRAWPSTSAPLEMCPPCDHRVTGASGGFRPRRHTGGRRRRSASVTRPPVCPQALEEQPIARGPGGPAIRPTPPRPPRSLRRRPRPSPAPARPPRHRALRRGRGRASGPPPAPPGAPARRGWPSAGWPGRRPAARPAASPAPRGCRAAGRGSRGTAATPLQPEERLHQVGDGGRRVQPGAQLVPATARLQAPVEGVEVGVEPGRHVRAGRPPPASRRSPPGRAPPPRSCRAGHGRRRSRRSATRAPRRARPTDFTLVYVTSASTPGSGPSGPPPARCRTWRGSPRSRRAASAASVSTKTTS